MLTAVLSFHREVIMLSRIIKTLLSLLLVVSFILPATLAVAEPVLSTSNGVESTDIEELPSLDDDSFPDEYPDVEEVVAEGIENPNDVTEVEFKAEFDELDFLDIEQQKPEASNAAEVGTFALATPAVPSGRYLLRPLLSTTRVLEVEGGSDKNGAAIQLFGSNMNQRQWFQFTFDAKTGYYTIQNVKTGRFLEVSGRTLKDGAAVHQWTKNSSLAQKWYVIADPTNKGGFLIVSALSPQSASSTPAALKFTKMYVLSIREAVNKNGIKTSIVLSNKSKAQSFDLLSWDAGVKPGNVNIANGIYKIASKASSNAFLEIKDKSVKVDAAVVTNPSNAGLAQTFMVKKESDGFYSIRPLHSAHALQVTKGNRVAGTTISQNSYQALKAQRWAIMKNADGSLSFISRASGMAMALKDDSGKAGTPLIQQNPRNHVSQKFTLQQPPKKSIADGVKLLVPQSTPTQRVEVAGGSRSNNANVQVSKADSTFSQRFQAKHLGEGIYSFQSVQSSLYVTAGNGTVVQQSGSSGQPKASQKWRVERTLGGYNIISVSTGQAMVLTAGGTGGHDVRLAVRSADKAQVFTFTAIHLGPPNGIFMLTSPQAFSLQRFNGKTAAGTRIQMAEKSTVLSQKWQFVNIKDDWFSIRCTQSGRVVGVKGNSKVNGSAIELVDNQNLSGHRWRLVPAGSGWFYLQSGSGLYLTANALGTTNGYATGKTSITYYAQKFRFAKTTVASAKPAAPKYFGTYVDVNLTTQTMMFVQNGQVVLRSDVVTGKPSTPTPPGTYQILYKESPTILRGVDYATPVDYWMPFTWAGHGLHDATWQPWFGRDRWTYAGSRGCVNMPLSAAGNLYKRVSAGMRVSVHW